MRLRASSRELVARLAWQADPARPGPVYEGLRRSQWWDRERLEQLQVERLREMLAVAALIPFHRERLSAAGIEPGDVDSLDDLARIPQLTREDLQSAGVARLSVPGARGLPRTSSGATGQPVKVIWPREKHAWFQAADRRFNDWLGVAVGERRLSLPNRPSSLTRRAVAAAAALNITLLPAARLVDPGVVRELSRSLARRPAALATGVSTGLYVVARSALDSGVELSVRSCWSGGARLLPHHRDVIEEALGVSVHERYRNVENGALAYECPEGRSFHVAAESVIVEIVRDDGTAAAPGEHGHVLVTDLCNRAMPLVRYRLGDRAFVACGTSCPCGRGLPVIGAVTGRERDVLVRVDGALVPPDFVVALVIGDGTSVLDLRIEQRADLGIRVLVVQRDESSAAAVRKTIARELDRVLGAPGLTSVERIDRIPLDGSGKLRHVVSDAATVDAAARLT